jgi:glycine/D-amino acid oxidase-like deaminating enzyme
MSLWLSNVDDDLTPRAPLESDLDVDVAIVGAGYTGLWTAYYLTEIQPSVRVAILEAEFAGYGASGRNGGWCSALFPQSLSALSHRYGQSAALSVHRALQSTVDEVGRVASVEGIDCHYAKGGTIVLVRNQAQWTRARAAVAETPGLSLLGAAEARAICGATSVLGATYTPDCAAIHPARLVRGLARVVARRGVRIYEGTRATYLTRGAVHTAHARVRAPIVVRATEGYTARLPGYRRALAPIYSLMTATEPLPAAAWDAIGLRRRETFSDYRHLIIYGQRTADDRLAFGGRGAPYHLGSAVRPSFDRVPAVHRSLADTVRELFPVLGDVAFTHTWGGPLGVARDWAASVGLSGGLAWAGGYVGDGVGTSNLAGRTLAHLITATDSELTRLPWVGHRSRRWEPEPARWLAINAALRVMAHADTVEARTGRPSQQAAALHRLLGN